MPLLRPIPISIAADLLCFNHLIAGNNCEATPFNTPNMTVFRDG